MRIRLIPDYSKPEESAQPRRKGSEMSPLRIDTKGFKPLAVDLVAASPSGMASASLAPLESPRQATTPTEPFPELQSSQLDSNGGR